MIQDRLLRFAEVRDRTSLSRTTVWRMEKQGQFPARRQVGQRVVAWSEREIQSWLDSPQRACAPHFAPVFSGGGAGRKP